MRTCFLWHNADIHELPTTNWAEPPWTDNGRIVYAHDSPSLADDAYHCGSAIAQINVFAILLRGKHNPNESGGWLRLVRNTAEAHGYDFTRAGHPPPTFMPFLDTGSWADIGGGSLDMRDPLQQGRIYEDTLVPFFEAFDERAVTNWVNPIALERVRDGRVPILLWGVHIDGVHGHKGANVLLRRMEDRCRSDFGITPAWIVDHTWMGVFPNLQPFGVHEWFGPPVSYTIHRHKQTNVTCGVAVPGFHDPENVPPNQARVILRRNGTTLRDALSAFRGANCDYVFLEALLNLPESAGFYRTNQWGDLYLQIVREHVGATR